MSLVEFALTLWMWSAVRPGQRRLPVRRARRLDPVLRHRLRRRHRRHQPVPRRPDGVPDAPRPARRRGESVHRKVRDFCFFMLALESAMIGVFLSLDLFLFYVFWDAMLIPMYFLIGIWGYERRIYAAVKFFLYTMAGSVLMLVAIIGLAYLHSARDRRRTASTTEACSTCRAAPDCRSGSSWPSRSPSRSRCRCSRSTRGCPTPTSRRRRPAPSSWPACC